MIRYKNLTIDMKNRVVVHDGWSCEFSRNPCNPRVRPDVRFKLVCVLLLAGPQPREKLMDLVYSGDVEGGPLTGWLVLGSMLSQLKPVFTRLGLSLHRERRSGNCYYWLEPT